MGAPRVQREVTVSQDGPITPPALAAALLLLEEQGVPAGTALNINGDGIKSLGWSVKARWTPEPPAPAVEAPPYLKDPEPAGVPIVTEEESYVPPEFCGRCSGTMAKDAESPSGWVHVGELDPRNSFNHIAVKGRPIRDNPQA